jgi:hypothetical protein
MGSLQEKAGILNQHTRKGEVLLIVTDKRQQSTQSNQSQRESKRSQHTAGGAAGSHKLMVGRRKFKMNAAHSTTQHLSTNPGEGGHCDQSTAALVGTPCRAQECVAHRGMQRKNTSTQGAKVTLDLRQHTHRLEHCCPWCTHRVWQCKRLQTFVYTSTL